MSKTSIKEAIQMWEEKTGLKANEAVKVSLICQCPPIVKMDSKLNDLVNCEHLSLSTNQIDKIAPLPGLKKLKILSLGRNNLKKLSGLEDLSGTLEELWISYNQIEKISGLSTLKNLRVLFMSNNKLKSFDELLKLQDNPELVDLLVSGNPFCEGLTREQYRIEVIRRLPNLKKLDGEVITGSERTKAAQSE